MEIGGGKERRSREGWEEVMERACMYAGGRGEGRVSLDTVVSITDVMVALLTMSLCCSKLAG